jgi:hypothetical protein
MHVTAFAGHLTGNDPLGSAMLEETRGIFRDSLRRRAFPHADEHDAIGQRHYIAAFKAHIPEMLVRGIEIAGEFGVFEARMKAVHG